MTPHPNTCFRCGLPLSQADEDSAADRGEPLYESACLSCYHDLRDGHLGRAISELPKRAVSGCLRVGRAELESPVEEEPKRSPDDVTDNSVTAGETAPISPALNGGFLLLENWAQIASVKK